MNGTGKLASTGQVLTDVNMILGQFIPLVGLVGVSVRAIIALAKANGVDVATFEEEMARYNAQLSGLDAAIADFRAKYGSDTPETPQPPPQP